MKASVKAQTQASLLDYTAQPRPVWVRRWPAMAVLAVSAISWSQVSIPSNMRKHTDDYALVAAGKSIIWYVAID